MLSAKWRYQSLSSGLEPIFLPFVCFAWTINTHACRICLPRCLNAVPAPPLSENNYLQPDSVRLFSFLSFVQNNGGKMPLRPFFYWRPVCSSHGQSGVLNSTLFQPRGPSEQTVEIKLAFTPPSEDVSRKSAGVYCCASLYSRLIW